MNPSICILFFLTQDLWQLYCWFKAYFPNSDMRYNMDWNFNSLIPARQPILVTFCPLIKISSLHFNWDFGIWSASKITYYYNSLSYSIWKWTEFKLGFSEEQIRSLFVYSLFSSPLENMNPFLQISQKPLGIQNQYGQMPK